jgi:hypothetical protein
MTDEPTYSSRGWNRLSMAFIHDEDDEDKF